MSTGIARGHGGDDGGDSSNPNRISTCEASSKQKKMRGTSRSKNLDNAFEANGKKPLPIQFDMREDTYNAVGPNANMFNSYIGNLVGLGIPPYYLSWDHVPEEFKKSIVPRLRHFFNLDRSLPEWPLILSGIEQECQDCYKNRKRRLKRHFDQIGGYYDVGNAQINSPPQLDHKAWCKTVKLFLDPGYMNRLMKNTEIYANDPARINHEAMLAEQVAHGSTSSPSVNATNVLGECHGHNRRRGRKLKGSTFSSFSKPPQPPAMPSTHDAMKLFIEAVNKNMQYVHDLFYKLSCIYPGIHFPPPPPPIIDAESLLASVMPQQSHRPPQQHDDDDDDNDDDDDDGNDDDDDETDSYDD